MCSQGYNHLPARSDAGIPSPTRVERSVRTSVSNLVRMCSQGYNHLPARGDAGTNPSHQRWFLPVSATRLRRYRCAVSRDERHCAASASHSGETQGDASPPPIRTAPAFRGRYFRGVAWEARWFCSTEDDHKGLVKIPRIFLAPHPSHRPRPYGTGSLLKRPCKKPTPESTAPAPTRLGRGRCKHPHHPSTPLPPLRGL